MNNKLYILIAAVVYGLLFLKPVAVVSSAVNRQHVNKKINSCLQKAMIKRNTAFATAKINYKLSKDVAKEKIDKSAVLKPALNEYRKALVSAKKNFNLDYHSCKSQATDNGQERKLGTNNNVIISPTKSGVEIEVSSDKKFEILNKIIMLRIGDQKTMLIRYTENPFVNIHNLIFNLTAEEFAQTKNGDPISVIQYGPSEEVIANQWNFGKLDKTRYSLSRVLYPGTEDKKIDNENKLKAIPSKVTAQATWSKANLTNFQSYPDNHKECEQYQGCLYAGQFAFVDGKKPESWVQAHNIIAVHLKDAENYKLKTFRLKQGSQQIEAVVYDYCSDSDCAGCCTKNANQGGIGFLIDIEKYTMQRFGLGDGVVEWQCLDCR